MDALFHTAFGIQITGDEVVRELIRFMRADAKREYRIVVGSDSEQLPNREADFVTAIVIHRVGRGGRYFWRRVNGGKFYTLRDRIIQEVLYSLSVAQGLLLKLKEAGSKENWTFEIHADIGTKGETSTLIQEVIGMIRAHNFEARTKPESYAATKVADRHA